MQEWVEKIKYLENLAQRNEKVLLDTNILNHENKNEIPLPKEIYTCKKSLSLDHERVKREINYCVELTRLINQYPNIQTIPEVYKEHSTLLRIINNSINHHNNRLERLKKHLKSEDFGDLEEESENLMLLRDYSNVIMTNLRYLKKRCISLNNEYGEIANTVINLSKMYNIRKNESYTDEKLVAAAFYLCSKAPVHLVSLDRDILKIFKQMYKKAKIKSILRYPLHLHTYSRKVNKLAEKVRYLPKKSRRKFHSN